MTIIQDFIPKGRKNRPGKTNPMKYITIHNTGNTAKGSTAKSHASYIKGDTAANAPVSWHYTVDEAGAYQHLPDNETAYHAGDGSGLGNTQSIGIEICENSDGNLLLATDNAARLVAQLCSAYKIPAEHIVQHFFWSGKDCPSRLRRSQPYSWHTFLSKISDYTEKPKTKSPEEITVDNALEIGIIGDGAYWLAVLKNEKAADPAYIKIVLDNAYNKVKGK